MPTGFTTKIVLFATVKIVGSLVNMLIYYFISSKGKTHSLMQSTPFVRNLNFHIKSFALSDIFSDTVSLPLVSCVQIIFDVFQHDWARRIVRFLAYFFSFYNNE